MKKIIDFILKPISLSFMAMVLAVACGPENIPEQKEEDKNDEELPVTGVVDSLENAVYRQVRAMQLVLIGEDVTMASCSQSEQEGLFDIALSTGASFQAFVGDDVVGVMTYVEEGSKKYWAVKDKEGKVTALTDSEGKKLLLDSEIDVKIKDAAYHIESDGKSFDLGYAMTDILQVFECTPLADPAGVFYAVEFNFGEGKTKTVYATEYTGVHFFIPSDETKQAVSEMYVPASGKVSVGITAFDGLDYEVKTTAEGWAAVSRNEADKYFVDVTAPEQISEGELVELAAVSADEAFTFAKIALTRNPFRSVFVSATDAVVIPSTGVQKFAYGISEFSQYSSEEILASADSWISGDGTPASGSYVSDAQISRSFADILGSALDPEARYVLWAYADGVLVEKEFGEIAVRMEIVKPYLLDVDVKVSIVGADAVFYGLAEKTETVIDDILYQISGRDSVAVSHNFVYEGKASEFVSTDGIMNELVPQTTYVLWVVPAATGEYTYTEKDVFIKEITTNPVVDGGTLELTCGEPKVTASSVSFSLACDDATMIYYAFLNSQGGARYSSEQVDNATKFDQIVKSYNTYRIGEANTVIGNKVDALCKGLNDVAATEYWLYAVAVDSEGKYGPVLCVPAKTLALEYDNSITLTVDAYDVTAKKATFKVTSEGGDLSDYIYWVGRVTDPFWSNSTYCGGTRSGAQKYMALNPEDDNIVKTMYQYGQLAEDGTITISGMTMETQYVFVILEKGEKNYSTVGYKQVTTLAADLGTIVREGSDQWNAAKNSVNIEWHKNMFEAAASSGMTASYGFRFSCPDNLTAYVMAASDTYFSGAGLTRMEHIMIEIENYSSRMYANGHTPINPDGTLANEPDYYKDGELKPGQLMNVYTFNVHGLPSMGFVTYFAKGSHAENNCIYWESGHCKQYDAFKESIARYSTLAPWKERAEAFGLAGKEADDWAQALLEAYSVYYKDAEPLIYENDGKGVEMYAPYAMGLNEQGEVTDRVVVMFKDLQGNYYEPMYFEVPNYFEEK